MGDYLKAAENKDKLGKRARINPNPGYCGNLHNKTGIIEEVCGNLFLKFDSPAHPTGSGWPEMDGVYLTKEALVLEA